VRYLGNAVLVGSGGANGCTLIAEPSRSGALIVSAGFHLCLTGLALTNTAGANGSDLYVQNHAIVELCPSAANPQDSDVAFGPSAAQAIHAEAFGLFEGAIDYHIAAGWGGASGGIVNTVWGASNNGYIENDPSGLTVHIDNGPRITGQWAFAQEHGTIYWGQGDGFDGAPSPLDGFYAYNVQTMGMIANVSSGPFPGDPGWSDGSGCYWVWPPPAANQGRQCQSAAAGTARPADSSRRSPKGAGG